jgi:hypothetical protein
MPGSPPSPRPRLATSHLAMGPRARHTPAVQVPATHCSWTRAPQRSGPARPHRRVRRRGLDRRMNHCRTHPATDRTTDRRRASGRARVHPAGRPRADRVRRRPLARRRGTALIVANTVSTTRTDVRLPTAAGGAHTTPSVRRPATPQPSPSMRRHRWRRRHSRSGAGGRRGLRQDREQDGGRQSRHRAAVVMSASGPCGR